MPDVPTPWVGLVAIAAMFVLPFLPTWLFEGPRRVRHWPREHICGRCGATWSSDHRCMPPLEPGLRGELYRLPPPGRSLERIER